MSEMHDVVEMLLNRMKDYPEDFVEEPDEYVNRTENKWRKALRHVGSVVAPHEKEALDIRLEEARRAVYMGAALKTMLSTDEKLEKERPQLFHGKYTTTGVWMGPGNHSHTVNAELNKFAIQMKQQQQKELEYQKAQRGYELSKYTIGSTLG